MIVPGKKRIIIFIETSYILLFLYIPFVWTTYNYGEFLPLVIGVMFILIIALLSFSFGGYWDSVVSIELGKKNLKIDKHSYSVIIPLHKFRIIRSTYRGYEKIKIECIDNYQITIKKDNFSDPDWFSIKEFLSKNSIAQDDDDEIMGIPYFH